MRNLGIARINVSLRDGRSVVTQQYGKAPLQVHRPLYLDGADHPTVFLKTPSAGLLAGDEHELTIDVEAGASLEVRTQACTLIYPGRSQQRVNITLKDGASLVFQPHALILAKEASLTQTISLTLGADCHLLFSDHWCAGRVAMNECWEFDRFENTALLTAGGELIYREHWTLQPKLLPLEHPLICGRFTHFKNTYTSGSHSPTPVPDGETTRSWTLSKSGYTVQRIASYV